MPGPSYPPAPGSLQFHRQHAAAGNASVPGALQQQGVAGSGLRQYFDVELSGIMAQTAQYFIPLKALPRASQAITSPAYPLQLHTAVRNIGQRVEYAGTRHAKHARQYLAGMKFAVRQQIQQLPGAWMDHLPCKSVTQSVTAAFHPLLFAF